jgi:hypothetical protein
MILGGAVVLAEGAIPIEAGVELSPYDGVGIATSSSKQAALYGRNPSND